MAPCVLGLRNYCSHDCKGAPRLSLLSGSFHFSVAPYQYRNPPPVPALFVFIYGAALFGFWRCFFFVRGGDTSVGNARRSGVFYGRTYGHVPSLLMSPSWGDCVGPANKMADWSIWSTPSAGFLRAGRLRVKYGAAWSAS